LLPFSFPRKKFLSSISCFIKKAKQDPYVVPALRNPLIELVQYIESEGVYKGGTSPSPKESRADILWRRHHRLDRT
jgi:hypothetical protein